MHLSDELLNEYLDADLTADARADIDRHLAGCPDCASRLEALRVLFGEIESLPETALSRDLAAPVMRVLRQAQDDTLTVPRWLRLTTVLEAAGALAALVLAAPLVGDVLASSAPRWALPSWTKIAVQLQGQWTLLWLSIPKFALPAIPRPSLDISGVALASVACVLLIFWLAGNGLLLRRSMQPAGQDR